MAIVMIAGEGRADYPVEMTDRDLKRAIKLLKKYEETGDWADELNTIIDRSPEVNYVGTIQTSGDCGGWYPA